MIDTIRIYVEKRSYRVISEELTHQIESLRRANIQQQISLSVPRHRNVQLYIERDGRLFLQCSLPKLFGGNNLHELEDITIDSIVEAISELFLEAGVEVSRDISHWILSRVDFCVNIFLMDEVSPYIRALDHFSSTRLDKKVYRGGRRYETISFNSRDKKECLICYDKLAEMSSRGTTAEKEMARRFSGKGNFIRLELQLKGQRKIEERLGENMTIGDVFDKELAYGKICEALSNLAHSDNFDYQTIALMDNVNLDYLRYAKGRKKKNAYQYYLLLKYSSVELMDYNQDLITYRRELLEKVFSSRTALKITKDIQRALRRSVRTIEPTDFLDVLIRGLRIRMLIAERGRRHLLSQDAAEHESEIVTN